MEECADKRTVDRMVVSRKGMPHGFRNTANGKDQNGQLCSRINCSSRVHSPKGAQIGSSRKGKTLKPSIQSSSSGKEAIGTSSRNLRETNNPGKSIKAPRKTLSSRLETDSSETSSVQDASEASVPIPPSSTFQSRFQVELKNAESGNVKLTEVARPRVVSNTRSQRNFHQPGLLGRETKSTGPATRAETSRYGLRNLRHNSISDIIPAGCSSSDLTLNKRKGMVKNRNCEGESSSTARGKKIGGSSSDHSGSESGICISDSRRLRNIPPQRDNIPSVRTQRSISGNASGRLSSLGNESPVPPNESPVVRPHLPHFDGLNAPGFSHNTSAESSLIRLSSYSRPGTRSEQLCGVMPASPGEYDIACPRVNRDSFRHYHMDGIAEVLLALERIEQNEELTHEEIVLLETNLLLNGLNFLDQHRDMRLDIDNMSYEELLDLEERMGTVSTALTEEALTESLKRDFYQSAPTDDAADGCEENKDDIKCSICQEEYVIGDEVGSLKCEHRYHVVCIQHWLRLKNWCPICKASAASSNSSSPS